MEFLKDKDIIIAILALGTPIITLVGAMINAKNEAKRKLMETNNDRRNEVYVAFLDTVSELEVENTKLYDEEYVKYQCF